MADEYFRHIEDQHPAPFALLDAIATELIARQDRINDAYLKGVVMEDIINAVIDYRINLAERFALTADLAEGGRDREGSADADALRSPVAG